MGKFFGYTALIVLAGLIAAGCFLGYFLLEGSPPDLQVVQIPETMGREYMLTVKVKDARSGIRSISAVLSQGDKVLELDPRIHKVKEWWRGSGVKDETVSWVIKPFESGMADGKALLLITARDSSWRNGLKGNEQTWETEVSIDMTPPRIAVKSTVHNIRTGGASLVSYRVSELPGKTGVWIGERFFRGYPMPGGAEDMYVAMVAVPFNVSKPKKVLIEAVDQAGNIARAGFPYRILRKPPKVDKINITDRFLEQKIPDFMARYPELKGSYPEVFLEINSELRRRSNNEIENYCKESVPEILWHGSFVCLPNSAFRAGFGDERHYYYKGKEIGRSYHMGSDLASVSHAPVPAGNTGLVVFADYLGIYGNTVILDHGLGLFSMYSHLSEIRVSAGDKVKRGEKIGTTGMTGLAGGDHLHFGMMVQGVFVNPLEWWDQKWIQDHILNNLSVQ
ncbi:MAG: M23 family metallopeptidase [Deltaproteobacteria bacterium]|nr:M23 family metallopeptidase [Deltaproteobacteria bacterium]MBW2097985.1 M23 family metallopeptidase [Deltaproteobacteria bacterium]